MGIYCRLDVEVNLAVLSNCFGLKGGKVKPSSLGEMRLEGASCSLSDNWRYLDGATEHEGVVGSSHRFTCKLVLGVVEVERVEAGAAELAGLEEAGVHESEVLHAITHRHPNLLFLSFISETERTSHIAIILFEILVMSS